MKRFFAIALVLLFACGLCFATSDGKQGTLPSPSSANLELNLDSDKYSIGFSSAADYNPIGSTVVNLVEEVNEDFTVTLTNKEIYFFYRALTDSSTVYLTLTIDKPLCYVDGDNVTDGTVANKTIQYSASLSTDALPWNGVSLTGETLYSSGTKAITRGIRSSGFSDYLAQGICKITISSAENLEEKVPGTYKSTITLSLTSV